MDPMVIEFNAIAPVTLHGEVQHLRIPTQALRCEVLRNMRREILDRPQALLGLREPPINALWGYVKGLSDAINALEGRDASAWSRFLAEIGFGSRTEYRVMSDDLETFQQQVNFLINLYDGFDAWLDQDRPTPFPASPAPP